MAKHLLADFYFRIFFENAFQQQVFDRLDFSKSIFFND